MDQLDELPSPARTGTARLPRVLTALADAVSRHADDPTVLPSLNLANGNPRQQRTERRVGCVQLANILVRYLDLASLRVGIPLPDGGFRHLTLAFLAKRAGLGLRRAERTIQDLQRAGLARSGAGVKSVRMANIVGWQP
ncbi:hypothetical protein [Cupriavidus necator]